MDEDAPRVPPARAPLPDAWWALPLRTRRIVAAVVAVLVVLAGVAAVGAARGGTSGDREAEVFVAALPPGREALWDDVAECESERRWDLDTGNGYFGGLQFSLTSWAEVGGAGSPADASRAEQIMRAEMLLDLQGWGAWPRCSARLGLG